MEIIVSLWTPSRTGVDPISEFFFHVFLVPHLVLTVTPSKARTSAAPGAHSLHFYELVRPAEQATRQRRRAAWRTSSFQTLAL